MEAAHVRHPARLTQTPHPCQERPTPEALEARDVPSTLIYSNTFDWDAGAVVDETVTLDAPGYAGLYLWNFHVTNDTYAEGLGAFALPAEDASMVSNLWNDAGWAGSVGTYLNNPDLVAWRASGQPE